MDLPTPPFTDIQYAFTRHLRAPGQHPSPPDVEERRMAIYRELLYNNIEGFIASNFPVLRKITPDTRWHELVRDFFARHQSRTPLFAEIAREFLAYLQNERDDPCDPPFLLELAHYEWVELALAIDPREIEWHGVDPDGDVLSGIPVVNPLSLVLSYGYPVHRIRPDFQPDKAGAQATFLVVYRDRKDKVGFIELNPVTAKLLYLLNNNAGGNGRALLGMIAQELKHPNPEAVEKGGLDAMKQLLARDVLLGVRAC